MYRVHILGRTAMQSIRCGLLLPMFRGLCVRACVCVCVCVCVSVCLSVCLSVGHNREPYKND